MLSEGTRASFHAGVDWGNGVDFEYPGFQTIVSRRVKKDPLSLVSKKVSRDSRVAREKALDTRLGLAWHNWVAQRALYAICKDVWTPLRRNIKMLGISGLCDKSLRDMNLSETFWEELNIPKLFPNVNFIHLHYRQHGLVYAGRNSQRLCGAYRSILDKKYKDAFMAGPPDDEEGEYAQLFALRLQTRALARSMRKAGRKCDIYVTACTAWLDKKGRPMLFQSCLIR